MLRRFFFLFVLSVLCVLSSAAARAQSEPTLQDQFDATETIGQEGWLDNALKSQPVSIFKLLVGKPQFNPDGSIKFGWLPGGAVGTATALAGALYSPQASGIQYLASTWNDSLGRPAYAQGVGFRGLQPLLPIWKSFRNAVYVLSSLVFIIIGLMIMLRVKISPQAVITLQNAIPNLITVLVLVTFSYAIAGLIIDLSYVLQGMFVAVIWPKVFDPNNTLQGFINGFSQFFSQGLLGGLIGPVINPLMSTSNFFNPNLFMTASLLVIPSFATMLLGFIIGFIVTLPLGPIAFGAGWLGAIIVALILIVMIFIWLLKFIFGLFKCYATIIFKIVIAPLEIGLGAFPNMKMGFSTWVTDLIANIAVFPISFAILILSNHIIINILYGGAASSWDAIKSLQFQDIGMWAPNILGGNLAAGLIATCAIGLSTLLLLSKLPDMIPQFVFMIKPSPWGQAIGQGFQFKPGFVSGTVASGVGNYLVNDPSSTINTSTKLATHPNVKEGIKGGIRALAQQLGGKVS